jgi:hypothetical protein
MSSRSTIVGNAPAYSDAEKGLVVDVNVGTNAPTFTLPPALPYGADEKRPDLAPPAVFSPPKDIKEKEKPTPAAAPSAKPAPKKRKKASLWVRWRIWFNTYRYGVHSFRQQ